MRTPNAMCVSVTSKYTSIWNMCKSTGNPYLCPVSVMCLRMIIPLVDHGSEATRYFSALKQMPFPLPPTVHTKGRQKITLTDEINTFFKRTWRWLHRRESCYRGCSCAKPGRPVASRLPWPPDEVQGSNQICPETQESPQPVKTDEQRLWWVTLTK